VDIVYNNRLVRRISPPEIRRMTERLQQPEQPGPIRTKIHLEVGWGPRGTDVGWDVELGVTDGEIIEVEPRFRGPEVLSPLQKDESDGGAYFSRCSRRDERSVRFHTRTHGNPTSSTAGTQGVCLDVELQPETKIWATLNGVYTETTVERLMAGGKSGHLRHEIDSPAWLFHRAPESWEFLWRTSLDDALPELQAGDFFYARVRQQNNQWAWGSPIFVR
jgi:hypothetical protein